MIDVLKEILLDGLERQPFSGVNRRADFTALPGKATVCMGVRRSGKSTFMHQWMARLEAEGVARENIVWINFVDDRLHFLETRGLGLVAEAYYSLYPGKKGSETVHFFFDEIQAIPQWESFVDRLMRTEKCEVYITGSSARMLSKEIATQMRGRSLSWELFPFSFAECLDAKGVGSKPPYSGRNRLIVQSLFEDYWRSGGFPEVQNLSDAMRTKVHQEYFQTILYRDLVERHDISHPKAIKDLAHHLIDNAGSLYSINSLFGSLKAQGHKLQKAHVGQYIDWMEDCYFLFSVRLFDASLNRSNANPKKIFCVDHAMVRSISSGILTNSGHLLENMVFASMRREGGEIFYYRTKSGKEVDFIRLRDRSRRQLVQVCETLVDPRTRKRELAALVEAMTECGLSEGVIVTRSESETLETPAGTVRVVPAWTFLLEERRASRDTKIVELFMNP